MCPTQWRCFVMLTVWSHSAFFFAVMLCESRLLCMAYCDLGLDSLPSRGSIQTSCRLPRPVLTLQLASESVTQQCYMDSQMSPADHRTDPAESSTSPPLSSALQAAELSRRTSSEIEIPAQSCSSVDAPFLVPSYCQSICQNYSDLQIGGEQVLPFSANDGPAEGPFLQSCDVLPAVVDSPPGQISHAPFLHPGRGGSNRWRHSSARDRSFVFHDREGPFSNSLLNRYLEQKLLDLYQQYMMENIAREVEPDGSHPGPMCPLLGSELVLTSLDQITLQLSREGNLEAGLAKDMVLSCLLRVAGDKQSSEISTPFLQISNVASREQLAESKDEWRQSKRCHSARAHFQCSFKKGKCQFCFGIYCQLTINLEILAAHVLICLR